MKVKIGKYRNRLTCDLYKDYMTRKHGNKWPETQTRFENFIEKLDDRIQDFYNIFNHLYFDRRPDQRKSIRIDPWDTWSMDHTLADIVVPMLIQLKETKHGAPYVDPEDVPEYLKPSHVPEDGDVDNTHFERWDWVLDEMIFAFSSKAEDNWEAQYYGEWVEDDSKTFGGYHKNPDDEGRKAHQERMSNGFRLFGRYFENLWD